MTEPQPPNPAVQVQLSVRDGRRAVAFYTSVFGAVEAYRFGGTDAHEEVVAQLRLGNAAFWVEDESPPHQNFSPESLGGSTERMLLVTDDPERLVQRAVAAGASLVYPVTDQHGWRLGRIVDPFGHHWEIGHPLSAWPPPGPPAGTESETQTRVDIGDLLDLATPWCLLVAATLRIPAHIAAGRRDIGDLAAAAGCDRDALHAVLGHLVAKGVFTEDPPGRFAGNAAAARLAEDPFLDLEGIGGRMAHTWSTLLGYVRTGQPGYAGVFGRPFWEDLAAHPRIAAEFDSLMGPAGHGVPDYDIELATGWDGIRSLVDVGGGTGAMLAALLRRHPQVRGTLVDLPGTVARAGEMLREAALAGRVTVTGQSFFDPLPAGADVYLLKSVLNDWPDRETVAILRRCAEAARPDGTVVVLGGVSPDEAPRALGIDMLVAGGKTSALSQFRELARQAGLEVVAAGTQESGRFIVQARAVPG
jgi:2,7-dihydroxy-5-methyl-1-naphthoate 7-O-methyltransferase